MDEKTYKDLLINAYDVATQSPDPSTQNGALIINNRGGIVAKGCNTFTKGVTPTEEMLVRPLKYKYIEHAERNCVFDACTRGVKIKGMTMVSPWAPCIECARSIAQSGLGCLVRHKDTMKQVPSHRWNPEEFEIADSILKAAKVEIIEIEGFLNAPAIRFNYGIFRP